jgi:hypothetical protein
MGGRGGGGVRKRMREECNEKGGGRGGRAVEDEDVRRNLLVRRDDWHDVTNGQLQRWQGWGVSGVGEECHICSGACVEKKRMGERWGGAYIDR